MKKKDADTKANRLGDTEGQAYQISDNLIFGYVITKTGNSRQFDPTTVVGNAN
jgi:hypothetical protein